MNLIIIWAIAVITIAILTLICYRKTIIHEYEGIIYSLCHATSSSEQSRSYIPVDYANLDLLYCRFTGWLMPLPSPSLIPPSCGILFSNATNACGCKPNCNIFFAAFISRSWCEPQTGHVHSRTSRFLTSLF